MYNILSKFHQMDLTLFICLRNKILQIFYSNSILYTINISKESDIFILSVSLELLYEINFLVRCLSLV